MNDLEDQYEVEPQIQFGSVVFYKGWDVVGILDISLLSSWVDDVRKSKRDLDCQKGSQKIV